MTNGSTGLAPSPLISVGHKSFPPGAWGRPLDDFLATRPRRSQFATPLLTLERRALDHNVATMFSWLREQGLHLAPHGKTTMSPALWSELDAAGSWGLTLATAWQAQVARDARVRRIMIANTVADPVGLRWIAAELDRDADAEVLCWVDGHGTIDAMERILRDAGARRRVPVIAELGAPGGRTGARSVDEAREVARRIHASELLELAGVGGYEGSLAHDRSAGSLRAVDGYLDRIAELHREVAEAGWYRAGGGASLPVVTAGGSAYFDRVADRLGPLVSDPSAPADVVLRSGAFQIHDDGFYAGISPMGALAGTVPFRSAMHAWVRVVSHPEPGLVLFDGGKRDLPFDEGLPVPQRIVGATLEESERLFARSRVTALNDQHGFLTIELGDAGTEASADAADAIRLLPVGTVIRLGLSHPCTALDKWRLIPVIDDADAANPLVIDAVETHF